MRVIGLTGGIASGKSSVALMLEKQGIPVIDADNLAREAVLPGSVALQQIAAEFGGQVLTPEGSLDRNALAEIVFADHGARARLESILHPSIKALAEQRLEELRVRGEAVAVYMAPLLIEAGATDRVDEVWVVYVDRETQLQRLMARDGISLVSAEQRLAAQMPMEEKAGHGRIVIDNRGTAEMLEKRVVALCRAEFGGEADGAGKDQAGSSSKSAPR
jgi:dephospho-CoA kinase